MCLGCLTSFCVCFQSICLLQNWEHVLTHCTSMSCIPCRVSSPCCICLDRDFVSVFPKLRCLSRLCVCLCLLNICWGASHAWQSRVCSAAIVLFVILLIFVLLFSILCSLCWWFLHLLQKCSCVHSQGVVGINCATTSTSSYLFIKTVL